MSAPLRATTNLAAAMVTIAVLLLGGWWLADRAHQWERPEWRHRTFVRLRGEAHTVPTGAPTWVVAVNLRCPDCLGTLTRLHADWERRGRQQHLVSLIVDTPSRPGAEALRALPTSQVWWDRNGIWRRRWGHRLYGELMQFDESGRLMRTLQADEIPDHPRPGRPSGPSAPATTGEGGT